MWLLLIAPAYAADTGQRSDLVDPMCRERTAPPEKCVIDDGPPPRPRAAGAQTPQTPPVTPPAPPGSGSDGGGQKLPPKATTSPRALK
jgi:hypothetical protein